MITYLMADKTLGILKFGTLNHTAGSVLVTHFIDGEIEA